VDQRVPRYLDLTLRYGAQPWSQPFLFEAPRIESIHNHPEHGRSNTFFAAACHLGTHIDAPLHFIPEGQTVDEIGLDRLIGPAVTLDVRRAAAPGPSLTAEVLTEALVGRSLRDRIAVLLTGWVTTAFGTDDYYGPEHPHLTVEAAQFLVAAQPKAVAVDTLVDAVEPPRKGDNPVHRTLLGAGIPLIENFANGEALPADGYRMIALPLAIVGADGAPARIVAELT
jgi:arylformamidase